MNTVAQECVVKKHHPEWSNVSYISLSVSILSTFNYRIIMMMLIVNEGV